jgi:hypothetical protein
MKTNKQYYETMYRMVDRTMFFEDIVVECYQKILKMTHALNLSKSLLEKNTDEASIKAVQEIDALLSHYPDEKYLSERVAEEELTKT